MRHMYFFHISGNNLCELVEISTWTRIFFYCTKGFLGATIRLSVISKISLCGGLLYLESLKCTLFGNHQLTGCSTITVETTILQ